MRLLGLLAAAGGLLIGAVLHLWGQPWICTCGAVRLWVNTVFSGDNSQHVADWYTLSHIVHGLLIVLIGRALGLGPRALLAVAVVTGVAWEIVEHTDFVLEKFRATTINQGYVGDSVLNAVCDYLFMLAGFALALRLRPRWILGLILSLEMLATVVARDSLTLTTLMLVWPIEAVEAWQQELNPRRDAPGDGRPGDEAPGDEAPGDERPGDERPGDEALSAPAATG